MRLLMTEFDCPEVTLSSWQGIKLQLLTNRQALLLFLRDVITP